MAGPPYEDIAFTIVNKDWEHSHKRLVIFVKKKVDILLNKSPIVDLDRHLIEELCNFTLTLRECK